MRIILGMLIVVGTMGLIADDAALELIDDGSPCFDETLQEDFNTLCVGTEETIAKMEKDWKYEEVHDAKACLERFQKRINKCRECSRGFFFLSYYARRKNEFAKTVYEMKEKVDENGKKYVAMRGKLDSLYDRVNKTYDVWDKSQQEQHQNSKK